MTKFFITAIRESSLKNVYFKNSFFVFYIKDMMSFYKSHIFKSRMCRDDEMTQWVKELSIRVTKVDGEK